MYSPACRFALGKSQSTAALSAVKLVLGVTVLVLVIWNLYRSCGFPLSKSSRLAFLKVIPNGFSVDETLYAPGEPDMIQLKVEIALDVSL